MRSLIKEQPNERPLLAGQWQFQREGQPTGAIEQWRLTALGQSQHVLRVDLDARQAPSGQSSLYHLLLDDQGMLVRLKFRLWGPRLQITGNVNREEDAVICTRSVAAALTETSLPAPNNFTFWFPSVAGLGLAARHLDTFALGTPIRGIFLDPDSAVADRALTLRSATVRFAKSDPETILVRGRHETALPLTLHWEEQWRTVWLNGDGWPVKMVRHAGSGRELSALTTRYINYEATTDAVSVADQHRR